MSKHLVLRITLVSLAILLNSCAPNMPRYDYSEFYESDPKSILVLPPVNNSPDIRAVYGFYSTVTRPLAEAGYYVYPVTLVDQTFKENGLTQPFDMHNAPIEKIREIFGADATLYITIDKYGSSYLVISSEVRVTASARLIDNKTGITLWEGTATASDSEGNRNNNDIVSMLVTAIIKQIVSNIGDPSYKVAKITSARLLGPSYNGILYGPRSVKYKSDRQ